MVSHTVEYVVPEDADCDRTGETVALDVDEDEYLLAAARANDLWLPADCQQGWCTTCAARLVSGEVDHQHAKRYYEVDRENGYVLTCVARPRADCRVRVCQESAMLEHRAEEDLPPGRSKR